MSSHPRFDFSKGLHFCAFHYASGNPRYGTWFVSVSVCLSVYLSICLLPRFLLPRARNWPKSDSNGFSATMGVRGRECHHNGVGDHNCGYIEDAGVVCSDGK